MKINLKSRLLSTISAIGLFLVPKLSFAAGSYRLFKDLNSDPNCQDDANALTCFVDKVWSWSQTAILVLAVAAFVLAGIIYMTSGGNPKQIESSKKIIVGALSAVAIMILGKFFLTNVIGVSWL